MGWQTHLPYRRFQWLAGSSEGWQSVQCLERIRIHTKIRPKIKWVNPWIFFIFSQ